MSFHRVSDIVLVLLVLFYYLVYGKCFKSVEVVDEYMSGEACWSKGWIWMFAPRGLYIHL